MRKPESNLVEINPELRINTMDIGEGLPVFFIQGSGPGASGWMNFRYNVEHFVEQGFRVIIPDLPGFGDSDKPDTDYTLEYFVDAIMGVADKLDIERFAVVGNSLGGAVGIGMALREPSRVKQLILMGCGGLEDTEVYFQQMEGIQAMTKVPLGSPEFTPAYLKEVLKLIIYDPQHITDELIEERFRILKTQTPAVFQRMRIPNLSTELSKLTQPVLGFWGAQDKFCPISGARTLVENCQNAEVISLSRCGHWVMVEYPELFNRRCTEFLKAHT